MIFQLFWCHFKPNPLSDTLSDCYLGTASILYDPTQNSISRTVFTRSRSTQRLFRSSASWCAYIDQALRTSTFSPPESILAGTDPLVVSIGTHPEASLFGPFIWVYRQPGRSMGCRVVVRDTRASTECQWLWGFSRSCLDAQFWFSAPENVRTSQRSPSAESKEWDNPVFLRSECESVPALEE